MASVDLYIQSMDSSHLQESFRISKYMLDEQPVSRILLDVDVQLYTCHRDTSFVSELKYSVLSYDINNLTVPDYSEICFTEVLNSNRFKSQTEPPLLTCVVSRLAKSVHSSLVSTTDRRTDNQGAYPSSTAPHQILCSF